MKQVHKSESKESIKNEHAVTIQSEIPTLLDYLVYKQFIWDCKNIIIIEQHGFTKGKSTTTATNLSTLYS